VEYSACLTCSIRRTGCTDSEEYIGIYSTEWHPNSPQNAVLNRPRLPITRIEGLAFRAFVGKRNHVNGSTKWDYFVQACFRAGVDDIPTTNLFE